MPWTPLQSLACAKIRIDSTATRMDNASPADGLYKARALQSPIWNLTAFPCKAFPRLIHTASKTMYMLTWWPGALSSWQPPGTCRNGRTCWLWTVPPGGDHRGRLRSERYRRCPGILQGVLQVLDLVLPKWWGGHSHVSSSALWPPVSKKQPIQIPASCTVASHRYRRGFSSGTGMHAQARNAFWEWPTFCSSKTR